MATPSDNYGDKHQKLTLLTFISITKKMSYVNTGANTGSKLDKAENPGVTFLAKDDLMKILGGDVSAL